MINLVPETHTAPPAARRRYIWRTMALVAVMLVAFTGFYAMGGGQPDRPVLNLAMVALCVAFVLAGTNETVALIRSLDELQQRIHILAWAIGMSAAVIVAFCWGFASIILQIVRFDPMLTVLIAVPGYYIALFLLGRRYG